MPRCHVSETNPVVVLSINALLQRLSSTTVVLVTGTAGPRATHIPLGPEVGLTGHDESYVVATELHNVPLSTLHNRRGRLSLGELRAWEEAVRIAHGLVEVDL